MINDYELQDEDLNILLAVSELLSSYNNLPFYIDFELNDEKHTFVEIAYITDEKNHIIIDSGGIVATPSNIFNDLKRFNDLLERLGFRRDGAWGYYYPDSPVFDKDM